MEEFRKLREVAAVKRDAAIKRAKQEHALTVQKIAELESRIRGPGDRERRLSLKQPWLI